MVGVVGSSPIAPTNILLLASTFVILIVSPQSGGLSVFEQLPRIG